MISAYPLLLLPAPPLLRTARMVGGATGQGAPGSWRYPAPPRSRWVLVLAIVLSAAFHAGLFLGVRSHPKAATAVNDDHLLRLTIAMPDLKDLEEPEPAPRDDTLEKLDIREYAPTLMDAPQIALPTDFVQELNYASLLPAPDLNQAKVFVIPQHQWRTGKLGDGLGNIFDLVDLDRIPEPIVQPSPIFPLEFKREVEQARVVVQFIVDLDGRVRNAVAVEDTHPGFVKAALTGVEKWRFRPGIRGGKRVNTRMSVPIIFRISDPDANERGAL